MNSTLEGEYEELRTHALKLRDRNVVLEEEIKALKHEEARLRWLVMCYRPNLVVLGVIVAFILLLLTVLAIVK